MSRFVAIVSHEIRTPLNALLNSLSLLADSGMAATQQALLDMARQSGDALLALINDILEMSRMEAGQLALRPSRFALRPLIESALEMFGAQAAERRIVLRVSIAQGVPDELYEDPGRLRQVLINLLSNAVKFAASGEVRVMAELRHEGNEQRIRLAVRDRGPVIPEASRARLFEPFSRLDDGSDGAPVGTGLGLTICRHLAARMGGEIGCEVWTVGGRDAGNEFWLTLPIKPMPSDARSALPGADAQPRHWLPRTRILLVEDILANQLVTAAPLRRNGHLVDIASNGAQAVNAAANRPYDLILMDIFMPGMSGLDTTRLIRGLGGPAATVPIVAMTASISPEDQAACAAAGMNGILGKPAAQRELLDAIARACLAAPARSSFDRRHRGVGRADGVADPVVRPAERTARDPACRYAGQTGRGVPVRSVRTPRVVAGCRAAAGVGPDRRPRPCHGGHVGGIRDGLAGGQAARADADHGADAKLRRRSGRRAGDRAVPRRRRPARGRPYRNGLSVQGMLAFRRDHACMLSPTSLSAFSAGMAQSGFAQTGPVHRVRAVGDSAAARIADGASDPRAVRSRRRCHPRSTVAARFTARPVRVVIGNSTSPLSGPLSGIDPPPRKRHASRMPDFVRRIPEGDNRERLICADCGHIAYDNPKVVVGSVVVADGAVLMCRRAIEPRRGFWTLPAGYLEHGETLEEGAAREAWEEAQAEIALDGILGVFSISRIGQVQVIFRARFASSGVPRFAAGPESLEVALFPPPRIPRDAIAFPSVIWALDAWERAGSAPLGVPTGNPAHDPRGTERFDDVGFRSSRDDAHLVGGVGSARHGRGQSPACAAGAADPAAQSADGSIRTDAGSRCAGTAGDWRARRTGRRAGLPRSSVHQPGTGLRSRFAIREQRRETTYPNSGSGRSGAAPVGHV